MRRKTLELINDAGRVVRGELAPRLEFAQGSLKVINRYDVAIRVIPYDAQMKALRDYGRRLDEHFIFGSPTKTQRALARHNLPLPTEPIAHWKLCGKNLRAFDSQRREIFIKNWKHVAAIAEIWREDEPLSFGGLDTRFDDRDLHLAIGNALALGKALPAGFHITRSPYQATKLTQRVGYFIVFGKNHTRPIRDEELRNVLDESKNLRRVYRAVATELFTAALTQSEADIFKAKGAMSALADERYRWRDLWLPFAKAAADIRREIVCDLMPTFDEASATEIADAPLKILSRAVLEVMHEIAEERRMLRLPAPPTSASLATR